ncbi:MAG: glycosyltransferase family 4 protein [Patescibacteria group bacterium]
MKTLLFTLEFPPFKGGIANYYGNLASHWPLAERLVILNNNRGELLRGRDFFAWRPAISLLRRKIKKNQIDYVLVGQILPLGTVAWLLSWFQSFKYGVFLHGLDLSSALKSGRKKWLAGLILGRADKIICANSYVARQTEELYPAAKNKIAVVNPGVPGGAPIVSPNELLELEMSYDLSGKTVLFSLGRLIRRKGFDQTIKALDQLPPALADNLVYFLAGRGPQEEYLRRLVPARLANKIIFLGELTETEKWIWLKKCDIFIMPARDIHGDFEGFGIVYLEANLSGKPVIAGRAGGVSDAVIDAYNGLVVDPEDPVEIGAAITSLAAGPELRRRLGEQGRIRAIREFNWEKQSAKLVDLITTGP